MIYEDKEFGEGQVTLDGNEFHNCRFVGSTLVLAGIAPVKIVNCKMEKTKVGFTGPSRLTLRFLASMYQGAGEVGHELVERILADVRSGEVMKDQDPGLSKVPPAATAAK